MPTLLQLKKKVIEQLQGDNEEIREKKIAYALDFAKLAAVSLLRRIQLIKLPDSNNFHQVEYDYKVWKAQRIAVMYFLNSCPSVMGMARGAIQKSQFRFLTSIPDCLQECLNTHRVCPDEMEFIMDSKHIALVKLCLEHLHTFICASHSPPEQDLLDEIKHTITRLEAFELKYDQRNVRGICHTSWNGESRLYRKIKML